MVYVDCVVSTVVITVLGVAFVEYHDQCYFVQRGLANRPRQRSTPVVALESRYRFITLPSLETSRYFLPKPSHPLAPGAKRKSR